MSQGVGGVGGLQHMDKEAKDVQPDVAQFVRLTL